MTFDDLDSQSSAVRFEGELPRIDVRQRQLACGLDVVLHRDSSAPQVTASVVYRVGSSDDRHTRTGFAHLFEHLFKSSPDRLGGHHYDVLRRAGASDANASTSADRTAYHETLPSNELALALWIESNRMGYFLPDFDSERLTTQQSVVRAERRQRYEDVPYGAERFALAAALWPDRHPLRHLTIGLHDDIQAATVDDVEAFYRTWYVPANATLVVAGDFVDAEVDLLLERYFGEFPKSTRPTRAQPEIGELDPIRTRITDRFAALQRIHRAWRGPIAFRADEAELDILVASLTATGTGPLWQRLVYETQLAQRVSAWTSNGRLGGELHVSVDLRTGSDPAAVRAILDEEIARTWATSARATSERDAQIRRVITRREAGMTWSLSKLSSRVSAIQRFMLYAERPDCYADEVTRYRNVTSESMRAAAARWLDVPYAEVETVRA